MNFPRSAIAPKQKATVSEHSRGEQMKTASKAYTSTKLGTLSRLSELGSLLAIYRSGAAHLVRPRVRQALDVLDEIALIQGRPIKNMDILEIGSGQKSIQLAVMGLHNRAVGIDRESSNDDLRLRNIASTIRSDGIIRAAKTTGRQVLGFDRAIRREIAEQLGTKEVRRLNVLKMDAECMAFPDASFDVVFSRAVFEHMSDPARVLQEVVRVIRPQGVFYCLTHLYSSYSGCHDARILANRSNAPPLWAHLREAEEHKVVQNTYLNRLKLSEWRTIFEDAMPGAQIEAMKDDTNPEHIAELAQIRSNGELTEYSDEELLTVTLKTVWRRA
jgi:SAM-dependent methyltransferase